jgi:hypothetical protein
MREVQVRQPLSHPHTILVLLGIALPRDVLVLASAASLASAMLDVRE